MFAAQPTGLFGTDVLVATYRLRFTVDKWGKNVVWFSGKQDMACQSFNNGLEDIMAANRDLKKKLGVKQTVEKDFEWKGFINVNLTSDDKANYAAWDIHDQDVWEGLATYAQSGYKINLSFNRQNDKFNVTFTGQPVCGENSGYAVSGFANTPYDAARVSLFKISTMLPEIWSEYDSSSVDDIG